ncbi:MAG: beta-galactosidase, partial [Clostridia bacterium]|nr:beta-galactosidase [Clostridia bacterium]
NPDGIYTYPDEEYLEGDILRGIEMGFDGARLHQRVFEPLTLYYCDKHGYPVWGEFGDWGLNLASPNAFKTFSVEWLNVMKRDFNHPSIIGWCPFNETHDAYSIIGLMYSMTKQFDTTRPVIDASGWCHVGKTDILDAHDYERSGERLSEKYGDEGTENPQISFLSEYGGVPWAPEKYGVNGWGYGVHPESEDEFLGYFRDQTHALLASDRLCAFCYTQLTDVEEEMNGLYTYDRRPKFAPEVIREIVRKKAKIEE